MYLGGDTDPPAEYAFLTSTELRRELPADAARARARRARLRERQRMGAAAALVEQVAALDRHRPPSRQHRLRHDQPARRRTRRRRARSCATSSRELDVELTPAIAEALYVALVTDTGRFQYTNTTPKALRLAAELVEAGVDVHRVFQGIYESVEFAKLKLLARALERAQVYEGGRLVISYLLRSDFHELGVGEEYAEGIIDYLRAVDGAEHGGDDPRAARAAGREAAGEHARLERRARRVRDRARSGAAAATARRPASRAPSRSRRSSSSSATRSRPCLRERLGRRGLVLVDKPAGPSSFAVVEAPPRPDGGAGGPRGDARPVRDRAAARPARRGDPARAVPRRPRQALRDGDRPARAHGDRRSRGRASSRSTSRRCRRARPSGSPRFAARSSCRIPRASAVKIDGERAYRRSGAARRWRCRCARSTVHELELHTYDDGVATLELASRPARTSARSRTRSAGHCRTLRRTEVGPFSVEDADEERIVAPADALPFLPCRRRLGGRGGRDPHGEATARRAGASSAAESSSPSTAPSCHERRPRRRASSSEAARGRDRLVRRRPPRAPPGDRHAPRDGSDADRAHVRPASARRARLRRRAPDDARAAPRAARGRRRRGHGRDRLRPRAPAARAGGVRRDAPARRSGRRSSSPARASGSGTAAAAISRCSRARVRGARDTHRGRASPRRRSATSSRRATWRARRRSSAGRRRSTAPSSSETSAEERSAFPRRTSPSSPDLLVPQNGIYAGFALGTRAAISIGHEPPLRRYGAADRGAPARLRRRSVRPAARRGALGAPARRAGVRERGGARRADRPRRRGDASSDPTGGC